MLGLAIYQRTTGPTYPKTGSFKIEGQKIKYKLIRSWGENSDAVVKIVVPNANVSGFMKFRRHPSYDDWSSKELIRSKDTLIAVIPQQPPAGKIMYQIFLNDDKGNEYKIPPDKPVIIRFKGSVPDFVLIPHIFLYVLFDGFWNSCLFRGIGSKERCLQTFYMDIRIAIYWWCNSWTYCSTLCLWGLLVGLALWSRPDRQQNFDFFNILVDSNLAFEKESN